MISLGIALAGLAAGPSHAADTVYYDTSWSYSYDAGKTKSGSASNENFRDAMRLPNGDFLCVGETQDSAESQAILLTRLTASGQTVQTKVFSYGGGAGAATLLLAKNGDYLLGGNRNRSPFLLRLDPDLNVKSAIWHYDSTGRAPILAISATVNSMLELENGRIAAAAGNIFPDNYGFALNNYAAYLEFDNAGVRRSNEWNNTTGYEIAGWSLVKSGSIGYLVGGKQAVFFLDSVGALVTKNEYTVTVAGVGSEKNKVARLRKLRDGRIIVVGQSYEEDSWTRNQRLNYDAWWTTLSGGGAPDARHVAGVLGRDDYLWDAAQLDDGRIAFIGGKGTAADSGMWVFVTDSAGKDVQWQKQYNLPGLDKTSARKNLFPMALQPTPDSGFVVVGVEGASNLNDNAFAFKFVPKPIPVSANPRPVRISRVTKWKSRGVIVSPVRPGAEMVLRLFDVQGVEVARYQQTGNQAGQARFNFGEKLWKRNVYLWELKVDQTVSTGSFVGVE